MDGKYRRTAEGRLGDTWIAMYQRELPRWVFAKTGIAVCVALLFFLSQSVVDRYDWWSTQGDYCSEYGYCIDLQDCFIFNTELTDNSLTAWWQRQWSPSQHNPLAGDFARCDVNQTEMTGVSCYRRVQTSPTELLNSAGVAYSIFGLLLAIVPITDLLPYHPIFLVAAWAATLGAMGLALYGSVSPADGPGESDISFNGYFILFLLGVYCYLLVNR